MTIQTKVMMKKRKKTNHSQMLRTLLRLTWIWVEIHPLSSDQHQGLSVDYVPIVHHLILSPRLNSSLPPVSHRSELTEDPRARVKSTQGRQKGSVTATPEVSAKSLTPVPSDPSRCTRRSASRLSTPFNNREKDRIPVKEEPEARTLRTRPSSHIDRNELTNNTSPPLGPDGQPLPTCVTCHNILPMISVDNQIVWGLNVDATPRRGKKRKEPQECPRYVLFPFS